jgi:ATP-dependent protease ClpP protease subunit
MNLFILGFINNDTVNYVVNEIVHCDEADDTIVAYINSEGGEGNCDYAIYEALRLSGKRIITHVTNEASSSAVTVYLAGDVRYATNYSKFMIHEPYFTAGGDAPAGVKQTRRSYGNHIRELEKYMHEYYALIAKRTCLTIGKLKKLVKEAPTEDWFFDTKEARRMGFVHKIGFPVKKAVRPNKLPTKHDSWNLEEQEIEFEFSPPT